MRKSSHGDDPEPDSIKIGIAAGISFSLRPSSSRQIKTAIPYVLGIDQAKDGEGERPGFRSIHFPPTVVVGPVTRLPSRQQSMALTQLSRALRAPVNLPEETHSGRSAHPLCLQ